MLNLSINEQKQILGGYYCVKFYDKRTGRLIGKDYYNTYAEASDAANDLAKRYSVVIIPIGER